MSFTKNKQRTYRTLPGEYSKTYFEDGVKKAVLFHDIIRKDELEVVSEITETHTYGCNEKGKFIELLVIINRRFFVIGESIKPFCGTLLLSIDSGCYRVYCSSDLKSLIAE